VVFTNHFGDFISALSDVFPEDAVTLSTALKFKLAIELEQDESVKHENMETLLKEFHASVSPFYTQITKRDQDMFNKPREEHTATEALAGGGIDYVSRFGVLFEKADEECRDTIWDYLSLLTQHAIACNMYENIPSSLGSAITDITRQVEDGTLDQSNLNLADVSQMLLSRVDQQEMDAFARNIMSDPKSMTDMMNVVMAHNEQHGNKWNKNDDTASS